MITRKATEAEKLAYYKMKDSSENWKGVKEGADKFYQNGADWRGLDDEFKVWNEARKRWDAEVATAGFCLTRTGIRKIK